MCNFYAAMLLVVVALHMLSTCSKYLLVELENENHHDADRSYIPTPIRRLSQSKLEHEDIAYLQSNVNRTFKTSGRIVNTMESTDTYPWVVVLDRTRRDEKTWKVKSSRCSGSITSESMKVLTAGHCLCSYYDKEVDGYRANKNCDYNKPNQDPANQQTTETAPNLNYITFGVGDKDHEHPE